MTRSVLSFLICFLLIMTIGACAQTPTKPASITFLTPPWGVPPNKELLAAFEKEAGFKIEIQSLPMDQIYSKVQIASAVGTPPADVIFLSEEAPSFIVAPGYLEPLDSFIAQDKDLRTEDIARMEFWKINDRQYGVTSYVQLVMMDYNEEKLRRAGFQSPPTTWDEMVVMARVIKEKGIDSYPISLGAIDWSWYLMSLSMGDPMFDDQLNPVFAQSNSRARRAMKMLIEMFTKDQLITPDMLTKVTPHDLFVGGIGVFHQSWQGAHAVMNNPQTSKQAPNVRYMILPEEHYTWSLDAALGISKYSKYKNEAWLFIKWYLSPENQKAIFEAYGLVPSRLSVQEELGKAGKIQQFELQQEQARYVRQLPRYAPWWGQWASFVTETIRKTINGQLTSDAAVDDIKKQWEYLREKAGK